MPRAPSFRGAGTAALSWEIAWRPSWAYTCQLVSPKLPRPTPYPTQLRVLLLDPDFRTGRTLEPLLVRDELIVAASQADGLRQVTSGAWDLILLDHDFSGAGLELLARFHGEGLAPVVLLAEQPSLEMTLEAIRRGAHDVLPKPLVGERVRDILAALKTNGRVRPFREGARGVSELVGASPEMLNVFKAVARTARSEATVLVLGESGTGKEMVARVLHAQSERSRGPFIAINCAAIPENLLESELFGHEKGAFTGAIGRRIGRFERANGGTLFLDEIGDMSIALQSKILRALQEREIERVGGAGSVAIDVRIVAATNRDLLECVQEGSFREDLYYRLAVVSLRLPPLRSRGRDLDALVEHFGSHYAREHRRPVRAISEDALELLRTHPWPGNVRQLRNAVERAVLMADSEVLLPEHFPADVREPRDEPSSLTDVQAPLCTLAEMERRMIERALRETGRNYSAAAERLGIHRNTLRRKLQDYGLSGS
jgi:DNA-binding NtrC family response regulator